MATTKKIVFVMLISVALQTSFASMLLVKSDTRGKNTPIITATVN